MAAIPASLSEAGRRNSSPNQRFGRGGAGNVRPTEVDNDELVDFETPTIKSNYYTTGRGGSGNMAKNTDLEEARKAQDVVAHLRRESESKTHVGRGGVANVFPPSQDEIATARRDNERWESAIGDEPKGTRDKGLAEKGKEWLFGAKGPKCVGQDWDNARRGADSEARGKDMLIPVRHYSLLFRSGQR